MFGVLQEAGRGLRAMELMKGYIEKQVASGMDAGSTARFKKAIKPMAQLRAGAIKVSAALVSVLRLEPRSVCAKVVYAS
jgi:hypothetical protein